MSSQFEAVRKGGGKRHRSHPSRLSKPGHFSAAINTSLLSRSRSEALRLYGEADVAAEQRLKLLEYGGSTKESLPFEAYEAQAASRGHKLVDLSKVVAKPGLLFKTASEWRKTKSKDPVLFKSFFNVSERDALLSKLVELYEVLDDYRHKKRNDNTSRELAFSEFDKFYYQPKTN